MNEKVLNTLEFHKITSILADYAGSEPGRQMCTKLRPSSNPEWISHAQEETSAALSRLFKNDRISFGANKDIRALIKSMEIGRTANASELLSIGRLLTCTAELVRYGEKEHDDDPDDALTEYFSSLSPLPFLEKEISRCILSEEEIADDASAELKTIRRSFQIIGGRIHSQLTNMVNSTYRIL